MPSYPTSTRRRVEGHRLLFGGRPVLIEHVTSPYHEGEGIERTVLRGVRGRATLGKGVCECGAESPMVGTRRERRAWHRAHKATVLTTTRAW